MGYGNIWFYDSRPRMKVFLRYLIMFIAFFIFSDIMIHLYISSMYKPIEKYEIQAVSPRVTVALAEATNANGNIEGTIYNNTNETITNKYLKFDFYTERNVNVGTKYIKIENLNADEQKEYKLAFRYDNVSSVIINVTDEGIENAEETQEHFTILPTYFFSGLILMYFFL